MEALLYSEVNIFSIIILLIIALETMILGYDKEFKNTLFIASVWCAAISNMLDFFGIWEKSIFFLYLCGRCG